MEEAADHTAEWLTFAGALTVAFIAAATAQWRQRGQLRHDRELRDLEELRALLDECAQAVGAASEALLRWTNVLAHTNPDEPVDGEQRGDDDNATDREPRPRTIALSDDVTIEIEPDDEIDLDELSMGFTTATEPIFALYQRVVLRLGQGHPVVVALADVQAVFARYLANTDDIEEKELGSPQRWQAVAERHGLVRAAHFTFLEQCRRLVGSRIREG